MIRPAVPPCHAHSPQSPDRCDRDPGERKGPVPSMGQDQPRPPCKPEPRHSETDTATPTPELLHRHRLPQAGKVSLPAGSGEHGVEGAQVLEEKDLDWQLPQRSSHSSHQSFSAPDSGQTTATVSFHSWLSTSPVAGTGR